MLQLGVCEADSLKSWLSSLLIALCWSRAEFLSFHSNRSTYPKPRAFHTPDDNPSVWLWNLVVGVFHFLFIQTLQVLYLHRYNCFLPKWMYPDIGILFGFQANKLQKAMSGSQPSVTCAALAMGSHGLDDSKHSLSSLCNVGRHTSAHRESVLPPKVLFSGLFWSFRLYPENMYGIESENLLFPP